MSELKRNSPGFFSRQLIVLQLFGESVLFALNSLRVNKLRSFLSLLGIAIGIFAIVSVFTAVDSMENNIRDSIKSISNNAVYVQKWPWLFGGDYPWWKYINRPLPGIKEMDELKKRLSTASYLAYVAEFNAKTIKYQNNSVENGSIAAVSHDYIHIRAFELTSGRYFSEEESASGKPYAVLGSDIASALFADADPIGKSIDIMGYKLQVIGVIKKEGSSIIETSRDNSVLVPVNYARNVVNLRSDRIDPFILVQAKDLVSLAQLKDDLKGAMRAVRKLRPKEDDDFALNESTLLSVGVSAMFQSIGIGGWIIGGFSILVGGFGIANIMFVSVKERTSIIGIQKSLGAKNYFILLQFLSESVILCVIGGATGLLLVYPLSLAATSALEFNLVLTQSNVIFGLSISAIIGIISGMVPAYVASQMNPVDAIRAN
ncbi:MAG TPA: ABC transporter permease [Bacteroidia bacterium]|nr:ABC transporter permease [Bacteroidia bacterium]